MAVLRGQCGGSLLAHGWRLEAASGLPEELVAEFIRPAVRAAPRTLAARLKPCRIRLVERLEAPDQTSQWAESPRALEVAVACAGIEAHDVAMEVLLCLGQVLWEALDASEAATYLVLLCEEIASGVTGEIDEEALEVKRRLVAGRASARSQRRLEDYARASFAATAAEYVHCLWHDVTIRTGPEHLPAPNLRRRLQMLARWFPPNRGYRLFAATPEGAL